LKITDFARLLSGNNARKPEIARVGVWTQAGLAVPLYRAVSDRRGKSSRALQRLKWGAMAGPV
jgi:hypothetical protein|tara:strand:+ start:1434 stop:1622 length:189 start_codon:yes stop_codon:yes gene_type:complete